ncbi:Ribosome biogenesis GTPase RsgA [Caenorhabditis elegans]|uniref:Ribosome biogenesis GTPase RsgA n=1 Tax=Caenorhabditis elegans TaxID=6239 RepID=Q19074_CAEEL|nr:Ribosome biogenesis GTPase RsgA [Caenorhabditis elegans]CCD66680.2 Ribosome biogenesis GTPase RsgA [Caenorhabditis elegans]
MKQAHNAKRRANAEQDRLELAEAAAIEPQLSLQ